MANCIDLKHEFGDQFRIGRDPAADGGSDPWMWELRCRERGCTIYPHGPSTLAVEVDYRPGLARKVARIPGVVVHQDGGWRGEMTFLFPTELFDKVAAIVKPRRRRRLTEEQRQRLAEAGAAYRWPARGTGAENDTRIDDLPAR